MITKSIIEEDFPCISQDWLYSLDKTWYLYLERLKHILKQNENKIPSVHSKNEEERIVAAWCNNQRQKRKKGILSQEKINILNNIDAWYWETEDFYNKWKKTYEEVSNFLKLNKRNPSITSKNLDEVRIATWCHRQRALKKKYDDISRKNRGIMDQNRINLLEKLPGWTWALEDKWDINFEKFKKVVEEKKRLPMKGEHLYNWMQTQKKAYVGKGQGAYIDEYRKSKLESIKEWIWCNKKIVWKNLDTNKEFMSSKDAAESVGIKYPNIILAAKNGRKAGGYRWARIEVAE